MVKKKEKGYTLIEMVCVILLMSLMSSSLMVGSKLLDELALQTKVKEVVAGIEYAKQAAALTGEKYNLFFLQNHILVRKGTWDKPIYTIYLEPNQKVSFNKEVVSDSINQSIAFNGTFATGDAGTIQIQNESLGKQARITVGVATGKVKVYYEKI